MRVGIGYDVHPLVEGRKLVLGGVEIPFHKGLIGHSDADVLVHAIMDALLGASSLGDIGCYFPPDEPRYRDSSSIALLEWIGKLLQSEGWSIGNVDATIVAERPRLAPWIDRMREHIGKALGIAPTRVGVKATTSEGLGFAGRGEGIVAHAVACIDKRERNSESS